MILIQANRTYLLKNNLSFYRILDLLVRATQVASFALSQGKRKVKERNYFLFEKVIFEHFRAMVDIPAAWALAIVADAF